jgi:serine/threonine protein phosphatase 1
MRQFTCGDIHGAYDTLMSALEDIGFDFEVDVLHALGDLIDRGPKNMEVLRLLDERWFTSIKGNHELILEANAMDVDIHDLHRKNGGMWFETIDQTERDEAYFRCVNLPYYRVVNTASGRKVGLVHAEVPGNNWDYFVNRCDAGDVPPDTVWGRDKITRVLQGKTVLDVKGIDAVYMGHNVVREPLSHGNQHWIDTNAWYPTGKLTIVELT